MIWEISVEDFQRISAQDPHERYIFALKKIAKHTEVWALLKPDEGLWAVGTDDDGLDFFPIWPHPRFAQACARDEWLGFVPQQVDLEDFVEEMIPAIVADDQGLCLFSTPASVGLTVDSYEFFKDLEAELSPYEFD